MTIHRSRYSPEFERRIAQQERATPEPAPDTITVTATCGHSVSFARLANALYTTNKIKKLESQRCRECRIADADERQRENNATYSQTRKIKKGQEAKRLPIGSAIQLTRTDDGTWQGTLTAEDIAVTTRSPGLMGIGSKLARLWLNAAGAKLTGKVQE